MLIFIIYLSVKRGVVHSVSMMGSPVGEIIGLFKGKQQEWDRITNKCCFRIYHTSPYNFLSNCVREHGNTNKSLKN